MSTETLWLILVIEIVIAVFGVRFLFAMRTRIYVTDYELDDEPNYYDDELDFEERHPALSLLEDLTQILITMVAFLAFVDIVFQLFVAAAEPFFGGNFATTRVLIGIIPNMF